jgi:hypothetical protein
LEFQHLEYSKWFCIESCKWGASWNLPTWSFFLVVLFCVFSLLCCVFLFCVFSLYCCLLLASSIAESSCCFRICSRNSVHRLVFTLAFTHCRELMLVGKLWWRSHYHTCYCWWSMNNCETGTVHTASMFILNFCACLAFVLLSFVLSFVYPSLEISVT